MLLQKLLQLAARLAADFPVYMYLGQARKARIAMIQILPCMMMFVVHWHTKRMRSTVPGYRPIP